MAAGSDANKLAKKDAHSLKKKKPIKFPPSKSFHRTVISASNSFIIKTNPNETSLKIRKSEVVCF